jgi:hypothetical protein
VASVATSFGAANVTATIDTVQPAAAGITVQCTGPTAAAGTPVASFTAGNCSTTAVVQIGLKPTITASNIRVGTGSVTIAGVTNGGASVALLQWSGTAYVQVATTTASASGAYSFTRTISQTTSYRVKSPTATGLVSARYTAYVRYSVALSLSTTAGSVTAKATVNPKVGSVEIHFYRHNANGTFTYLGKAFTNASGVATKSFATTKGTSYTIAARAFATSHRLRSFLKQATITSK